MTDTGKRRPIRSYVLRMSRMSASQQRGFDQGWERWGLEHRDGVLDFEQAFGRAGPTVLEIGFGMGQSLLTMSEQSPDSNFVGIEVHRPGVGKLLQTMVDQDQENIRIYCHDAVEILRDCIPEQSLDTVQIFFPDPWHKKRHNKRRLIQPGFVEQLCRYIRPGGMLHLATDWQDYAEQMMKVLSAAPQLQNSCGEGQYAPRPEHRPLTKFEKRGERLGHGVWDLMFLHQPS